jgi:hypothetical protein
VREPKVKRLGQAKSVDFSALIQHHRLWLRLDHRPMKLSSFALIALFVSALASIRAQDSPASHSGPPLAGLQFSPSPLVPGDYLLIHTPGLDQLRVSFKKDPDGKLVFSCPDAPFSPPNVYEHEGCFQFCIMYLGDKTRSRSWEFRTLVFAGTGSKRNGSNDPPEYGGKVATMLAYQPDRGSTSIQVGDFILCLLSGKP